MSKHSSTVTSIDELALVLSVDDICKIMGISRATGYLLVHTEDFPVIHCGRKLKISKKAFFEWLDKQSE